MWLTGVRNFSGKQTIETFFKSPVFRCLENHLLNTWKSMQKTTYSSERLDSNVSKPRSFRADNTASLIIPLFIGIILHLSPNFTFEWLWSNSINMLTFSTLNSNYGSLWYVSIAPPTLSGELACPSTRELWIVVYGFSFLSRSIK